MNSSGPPFLRPTELAAATVFGAYPEAPALPEVPRGRSPRQALEDTVLPALLRPPCGVSFSGGRDSSLVLAVAAHVARREGLPLPVPITHVFPDVPHSREDQWQELSIEALGLEDWIRLTWYDEMDVLGASATGVLRRVGVLDPFNAFFHDPICAQIPGGSLLTGVGGDELLSGVAEGAAFRIRYRHVRPRLRQLRPLAYSYAPQAVRARRVARQHLFGFASWMRAEARDDLEREYARWTAADPLAWDASIRRFWGSRECHLGLIGLELLASAHDVQMVHPLNSAAFVATMIAEHGPAGPGGRAGATAVLTDGLLPPQMALRPDKAGFGSAFWTGENVGFAETWSGAGVDLAMIDPERLRAEWRRPGGPHVGSLLLLQQAWLHDAIASTG